MNLKKVKYLIWSLGLAALLMILVMWVAANWLHSLAVVATLVVMLCLCAAAIAVSLLKWRCPHCGDWLGRSGGKYCPHCGQHLVDLE